MKTSELLLEFSSKGGVSGMIEAQDFAVSLLKKYGKVEISPLGSVICTVKEPLEGEHHIMLDSHIDEIGLIVSHIEDDGFLRVGEIGGTDPRHLAASPVVVHTEKGALKGVICSVPPHLSGDEEKKNLPADKAYIDVGLSGEKAKELIRLGDRITFSSTGITLLGGNISAKALDNRSGCVSLIKTLDYLGNDAPCGLTVVFSSMEEIGHQGASTAAYSICPTHALVVDVGFAKIPSSPPSDVNCGDLGAGPMVSFSPLLSSEISRTLVQLAEKDGIPYQQDIYGGRTGTNADVILASKNGIPTGLLSIPLRYMHMPIEVVNVRDVENTGKLISLWIKHLGKGGSRYEYI